jgi:hypothetical protein
VEGYAYDVVLLQKSKFVSTLCDRMQGALNCVENWCGQINLYRGGLAILAILEVGFVLQGPSSLVAPKNFFLRSAFLMKYVREKGSNPLALYYSYLVAFFSAIFAIFLFFCFFWELLEKIPPRLGEANPPLGLSVNGDKTTMDLFTNNRKIGGSY